MKNLTYLFIVFLVFFSKNTLAQNNALNFDGIDDFVQLNSDFDNADAFDGEFTIEFWIKTNSLNQSVIMSKWNEGTDSTFKIETTTEGKIAFFMDSYFSDIMTSDKVIADNTWHHVAITKKNSFGVYRFAIWIDAIEQSRDIYLDSELTNTLNPFYLAKDESNTLTSFRGEIDELRIWSFAKECPSIYSEMKEELTGSQTDLVLYHDFNQGTAAGDNTLPSPITTLVDNSLGGRDGTLNNFALVGTESNWVDASTNGVNSGGFTSNPKINIKGNGFSIPNGDTTPSFEDETDFGAVNGSSSRFYSIKNIGINSSSISITSSNTTNFSIFSPPTGISSCSDVFIQIQYIPSSASVEQSTITITTDDPITPIYTFTVQGNGAPQLDVTGNTNFGNVDKCDVVTEIFTIENIGFDELILYGNPRISGNSGFKISSNPTLSTLLPNTTTTFEVEYSPNEAGFQEAVIFINSNGGQNTIYLNASANSATYPGFEWETLGEEGFSAENTQFHSLKIANSGTPYVAFQEGASQKTSVMKYNGSTWEYVGQEISIGISSYQSLAIDNNENLYVAYQDGSNNNGTTILKYDGINWTTLGSAISGINNEYQNIVVDTKGTPFVGFRNQNGKAKIMTYNINGWQNVGSDPTGLSSSTASYISLVISPLNELYVAYKDETQPNITDQGTTLMYFDESDNTWNVFDASDVFSNSTQQNLALSINSSPYIAFLDGINTAEVIENSEGWNFYGSSTSTNTTSIGNIVMDVNGTVYFCFVDGANSNKATVRKNDGSDWEDVGIAGFSEGAVEDINLALDNNGTLYVAYKDLENDGKTTVMKFLSEDDTPEINVQGNNQDIAFGSTTPVINNDTDFDFVALNTPKTITYTIQNTGDLELNIYSIDLSNMTDFFVSSFVNSVDEGDFITFDITYNGSMIPDVATSTVTINSSDCDERAYSFDIKVTADVLLPIIKLYESSTFIPNSTGNSTFGTVFRCGNGHTKTLTIKNEGNTDLDITAFYQIGSADFTIVGLSSPTPITIPRQKSRNFTITFRPSSTVPQTVNLEIYNTDINANPYIFSITGTGREDTEAPILITMPDFVRNTDSTNCFFTNTNQVASNPIISDARANDFCRIASYSYVLSGATNTTLSSLANARFEKGITRVVWNATDEVGNVSTTDEFLVTIEDRRNPILIAPPAINTNTDLYSCFATISNLDLGEPTVSDNCLVSFWNNAPNEFPIGQTTVFWTARDSSGNVSVAEQIITVNESLSITPSDSLILVQMYNQMGGQNWNRTWNLNNPVSTWAGISITCGKISSIDLSSNNLTGRLPNSVLNLSQRTEPNFSLNIGSNRLLFTSAENFVGQIPNFTYSPQAQIYSPYRQIIQEGQTATFDAETEGDFISYQWYKNQNRINGANNPTFTITNAQISDAGIYVCEIKSSVATQLTLTRHPITLIVEGFVNPTDSLALVQIFEETGGRTSWRMRWNLQNPVATWEGITLSGNKLIELDLSSNNMTGILPNVFNADLFSELRYLSFFDNELEGLIPSTIGEIRTLTYLDLDKNNFEGVVPASFGNLTNLQALWLSRNKLTELPDEIGNLISLKNLYLNDNKFNSLPQTIGNLRELQVLNVSDNQLINLPNSITNLQKLIQFYANRNFIVVLPTPIQNLIALVIFEINTNKLSSLPTNLLQINNLKELRIAENQLEFDDLLPFVNHNFIIFDYAPQAPINEEADILVATNSSVTFTITTQGNGNNYQWLKNGNPVSTLQNFTLNRVRNSDAGIYSALITNPSLPNLTLERRSVRLNIECQAGLNFGIIQPEQTTFCEDQPFGLKLAINDESLTTSQIRWRKDGIVVAFANQKNYTVTEAGTYTAEVITTNGCTALSNQVEIIVLSKPQINIELRNEETLTSTINTSESVTYQWLKDGNSIADGFERTYTPTETGEYSLLVLTESGCTSVSQTIIFTADGVTGIEEPKQFRNLKLFPNPNTGNFFIDFDTNTPKGEPTFILIDAIGRQLNIKTERISSTRYQTKTTNLAGGIYYLQIQTKDGIAFRKFVIEE